jgi:hypothetical protein
MVFVDVQAFTDDERTDTHTFTRQCSPVFTLYTHGLHAATSKVRATASWTRIIATNDPPSTWVKGPDEQFATATFLAQSEPRDNFGFSEVGLAQIDPALILLPPSERGHAYLDWLHNNMVALARLRGWDDDPLHQARQYCLDRNVVAHFESPRRQSRDRRHKAVLTLDIDPDGLRHLTITVTDRQDAVVTTASETHRPFHLDFYDWKDRRRYFAWTSATRARSGALSASVSTEAST